MEIIYLYACAEGSAHLTIVHALHLPEPVKKPKSEGCVPTLRSGPLAALRFGSTWKKERIMPSSVATMSALARSTFAPKCLMKDRSPVHGCSPISNQQLAYWPMLYLLFIEKLPNIVQ